MISFLSEHVVPVEPTIVSLASTPDSTHPCVIVLLMPAGAAPEVAPGWPAVSMLFKETEDEPTWEDAEWC